MQEDQEQQQRYKVFKCFITSTQNSYCPHDHAYDLSPCQNQLVQQKFMH